METYVFRGEMERAKTIVLRRETERAKTLVFTQGNGTRENACFPQANGTRENTFVFRRFSDILEREIERGVTNETQMYFLQGKYKGHFGFWKLFYL